MKMFWVIFFKSNGVKFKSKAQILTVESLEVADGWAKEELIRNKYSNYRVKPY